MSSNQTAASLSIVGVARELLPSLFGMFLSMSYGPSFLVRPFVETVLAVHDRFDDVVPHRALGHVEHFRYLAAAHSLDATQQEGLPALGRQLLQRAFDDRQLLRR